MAANNKIHMHRNSRKYYYKVTVYKHEEWPAGAVGKGYAKVESMASVAMRK